MILPSENTPENSPSGEESPLDGSPTESEARPPKFKAIDQFSTPQQWDQLVSLERPAELEIGSGKGLFLQNAATAQPDHDFVGIELAAKFANRAAERLGKRNLTNAKMLRGDAQRFLREVVPDRSLVRVHVYFPDPWWRNKHKKRRVLNEQALADIERALVPGGEFHFWTDVLDYYEHICGQVMDLTKLAGPRYVPQRTAAHSMDYTTHFERRARTHGQPVYRAIFLQPSS
ncbi:tRNA (guanosine(46)-N7)-methyltransferase TrmB [Aureliella helgolandensis]|uniref:tRNA (guanine-N(7)-)-methyltransferase n=1 Tax=Aureliella helgolandensis TaxID=2527968 RepID=A0A518G3Z5_9BACT|nr:tRNA (guanosine(46)-N7)-methyltransferase TrmB [Aureliella helgolandensis]QDV23321.1 tRNA (guanine-N(7)-)-methyltransferase [Aureliella helgolandensis]